MLGDDATVKSLIDNRKVVVNFQNETGKTALHHAARQGKFKNSHIYLNNETFCYFCYIGHPHIIKSLIERRANVNLTNLKGRTPLHIAFAANENKRIYLFSKFIKKQD